MHEAGRVGGLTTPGGIVFLEPAHLAAATRYGRSMEEEARVILREAVGREAEPENLAIFIHECFAPFGGVDLELPPREPMREPPDFS